MSASHLAAKKHIGCETSLASAWLQAQKWPAMSPSWLAAQREAQWLKPQRREASLSVSACSLILREMTQAKKMNSRQRASSLYSRAWLRWRWHRYRAHRWRHRWENESERREETGNSMPESCGWKMALAPSAKRREIR